MRDVEQPRPAAGAAQRIAALPPGRAALFFLALGGMATLVLIASGALGVAAQTPHDERPVLGLAWLVLLLAISSTALGGWLAIFRADTPARALALIASISAIASVSGSLLLVLALAIALATQPDPALYRVSTAADAVTAARAVVPKSAVLHLTQVEALHKTIEGGVNDVTWHVQFATPVGPAARYYDVLIDGVSGETLIVR